jgi:hypothetical protein
MYNFDMFSKCIATKVFFQVIFCGPSMFTLAGCKLYFHIISIVDLGE